MQSQTYCFDRSVTYREIPVQHPVIEAYFELYNPKDTPIIVIPDGALDIVFLCNRENPAVYAGGTALRGRYRTVPITGHAFGVRMKPGIIVNCFRDRLSEIVDSSMCLTYCKPFDRLLEKILLASDFAAQAALFHRMFRSWASVSLHPITASLLAQLEHGRRGEPLSELIDGTAYSHVHVNRVFKQETGMSLKFFVETLRIQQAIYLMRHRQIHNMQTFSTMLGFYDQAHFTKSFKYYTCYSPKKFYKNMIVNYND